MVDTIELERTHHAAGWRSERGPAAREHHGGLRDDGLGNDVIYECRHIAVISPVIGGLYLPLRAGPSAC